MQTVANSDVKLPRPLQAQLDRLASSADVTPTPEPQPTPEPAPTPAAADPRESDPKYWRSRFETVAGLRRQERDQHQAEIQTLRSRVAELEMQLAESKAVKADTGIQLDQIFTPEQIEMLGEDQARAIAEGQRKAGAGEVAALRETVQNLLKQNRETAEQAAERIAQEALHGYHEALTELVPNWREIDAKEPRWLVWLGEDDEHTGQMRQEILNGFIARRDAPRTAAMFKAFMKSIETPVPPVAADPAAGIPNVPTPPAPSQGYPTQAEMKDYYKRASLNKVTDEERIAFERRLRSGNQ